MREGGTAGTAGTARMARPMRSTYSQEAGICFLGEFTPVETSHIVVRERRKLTSLRVRL